MNDPSTSRRDFMTGRGIVGDQAQALDEGIDRSERIGDESRVLTSLSKSAMGCTFECLIDAKRFPFAPEIVLAALELVEEVEQELSVYRPTSHLSEVNRLARLGPVPISARLLEILKTSLDLHEKTNGAFDVTAGPLSKAWGFYQRNPRVPSNDDIRIALSQIGSQFIELDRERSLVHFRNVGLEINLASIGKGFAIDWCGEYLRAHGVEEFVLHGGQSSVLAAGCQDLIHPPAGWTVGLVHPVFPQARAGFLRLHDRALGTSGCQRQWLVHQGQRLGHILDPRTGWPAMRSLSATVLAPRAGLADALATAFSVMSLDEVERCCQSDPSVSAIIALANPADPVRPKFHLFNIQPNDWQPISLSSEESGWLKSTTGEEPSET